MTQVGTIKHDPIPIGEIAKPPFVRLPDPLAMFARRAARLRELAGGHELHAYLKFLADLCDVQHRLQTGLPDAELPPADVIARSRQFRMPPLDRTRFGRDGALDAVWARLLAMAEQVEMPDKARIALERVRVVDPIVETTLVDAVLANEIPTEALAEHVFVAAALQVHFARLSARLDANAVVPVGQGACPACGALPVSTMVVGWSGADATRFCACSLCGTLWNYPRIKCTLCGSTKDVSYQEISGGPATVKAETCGSCGGYVKIMQQREDASLDPIADDVATLALDLMLRDAGFRRGAVNPFLFGY